MEKQVSTQATPAKKAMLRYVHIWVPAREEDSGFKCDDSEALYVTEPNHKKGKTMKTYSSSSIRSIGWLHAGDGSINLTPVLQGSAHCLFVNVSMSDFEKVRGDTEAMKKLALERLGFSQCEKGQKKSDITKTFLSAIDVSAKRDILASIAVDYKISIDEAEDEVCSPEAEHLLDYLKEPTRSGALVLMKRHGFIGA